MKNIPELSCAIVEDLLPTYVERLTSEETNMAVEAHLASCPACAAKRAAMGAKETEAAAKDAEETAREVDYLKKVRRRNRRQSMAGGGLATTLVLAAVICYQSLHHWRARDKPTMWRFALVEIVDGDTLSVQCGLPVCSVNAFYGWEQDETVKMGLFLSPPVKRTDVPPVHSPQTIIVDLGCPLEGLDRKSGSVAGLDLAGYLAPRCRELRGLPGRCIDVPHPLCRRRHCRGEPGP